ncbi:type II toxin-antitoxin system VapC family toxin [Gloeobacter morelensis]|uniref:Type II toxin-antitoxin system VapC family toxin n=1 Tax=Gloeobacter morelensis MG652769 TaxID=2781736 RepID=A0ABY3PQU6_9CYAN|nr:type II toxin-antitoxin system VapC family toxin [Gloeobacter morelensis]UFP96086.1 type II toxin-antitoxin system VapC family toxin [Gloeobacter morelensis MG652769]
MKLLLDTHLLLLAAGSEVGSTDKLSVAAVALIDDRSNELLFSAASIWEVTIKNNLGRADFMVDPRLLLRGLRDNGYAELSISSAHTVAVGSLPNVHKDPFDRLLVAQAIVEGITLVTCDPLVASYPGPIRKV